MFINIHELKFFGSMYLIQEHINNGQISSPMFIMHDLLIG